MEFSTQHIGDYLTQENLYLVLGTYTTYQILKFFIKKTKSSLIQ